MSNACLSLKRIGPTFLLLTTVLGSLFTIVEPVRAQTLSTLYSFKGGTDGGNPDAGLVVDPKGNLYGTTVNGGSYGNGTVFEVSESGNKTVLHSFAGSPDGASPFFGTLVRDAKGNLYGATYWGGTYGGGTVFELTKKGQETVLFSFGSAGGFGDGQSSSSVVRDALGNLYGATNFGGAYGCGTVYEVTPTGNETTLHNFQGYLDGCEPESRLIRDSKGNLYGTTFAGGGLGCNGYEGCGTVFEVTPSGTETVLHSFSGPPSDGQFPSADLVQDPKGNLYGVTPEGGTNGVGTVFELTKKGSETILHNFVLGLGEARNPNAGLFRDKQGNFYGTTTGGGSSGDGGYGWGTIFKMTQDGTVTVLYSFTGGADGGTPWGDLVMDKQGNLYGTTVYGGVTGSGCWSTGPGCGTVFKLTP